MSSRDPERPPERLIHGEYGPLLRQASREWEWHVNETAAFQRVLERMAATQNERARARKWWLAAAAAPLACATLAAVIVLARGRQLVAPELVAETWSPPVALSARPSVADVASPALKAVVAPAERSARARAHGRAVEVLPPRAVASVTSPIPSANPPLPSTTEDAPSRANGETGASRKTDASEQAESAPSPAPDCMSLAREGQSRAAEACFVERAQGAGLAAEMALHELARLRRDVLADPTGALAALADYRKRFPAGSLRREVDVSQLELLLQLGRSDDALKQSEELLSSSTSGERASELRLLRGNILRKQSRFAEAAREYELAERGGARAAEALYFRALCLEAQGLRDEAAAALSKYLEQPRRPYAEDAKRRLEKLKP